MEMDTGIVIDSTPAATVAVCTPTPRCPCHAPLAHVATHALRPPVTAQAIPPAERMTKVSAMVAANFEGLSAAFVQRSLEFRACSAMRWPRYTPKPLPKSVKVVIVRRVGARTAAGTPDRRRARPQHNPTRPRGPPRRGRSWPTAST